MRSEQEMMRLILDLAESDSRILAAYLKGSRANPNAPKDRYRDFDLMYVVTETESFIRDTDWMKHFGTVVFKQEQDDDYGYGDRFHIRSGYEESYSWLLLFEDGNRIDVGVELVSVMKKGVNRNRLTVPLLDKAGCLPKLPSPSDEEFYVKQPSEKNYLGCCNNFYWCLCDVAKGIMRDELPFAMTTYHTLVREMLELMLGWYVGIHTSFAVSCGKLNKYFKTYLPSAVYEEYVRTYTDGDYTHFWAAIDTACRLFRRTAVAVGDAFGFSYPEADENAFRGYVQMIRNEAELKNFMSEYEITSIEKEY